MIPVLPSREIVVPIPTGVLPLYVTLGSATSGDSKPSLVIDADARAPTLVISSDVPSTNVVGSTDVVKIFQIVSSLPMT